MRPSFTAFAIALIVAAPANAQSNDAHSAIAATVQDYLDGTANAEPEKIDGAFADSLEVQWLGEGDVLMRRTAPDYIDLFRDGQIRDRKGRIVMIDATDRAATVKVEIEWNGRLYTDYMLLLRIEGDWQITNKIAVWSQLGPVEESSTQE